MSKPKKSNTVVMTRALTTIPHARIHRPSAAAVPSEREQIVSFARDIRFAVTAKQSAKPSEKMLARKAFFAMFAQAVKNV